MTNTEVLSEVLGGVLSGVLGMDERRKGLSIGMKMYIFVIITVLAVALGTGAIAFRTAVDQIDKYYKQNTADNARNFASMVDGDFLRELKEAAASKEFQELREKAEKEEDEALIREYLEKKGLWKRYISTRDKIDAYLENMEGIKYLYIVAHGDINADRDMYLLDDKGNPIYETGYYEERETELRGMDLTNLPEPTISHGDWGWLCSDFKPVYDSKGECICIVGCDIGMDDVMAERQRLLFFLVIGAFAFTSVILALAVLFINKVVVKPLDSMTDEMKKFKPSENLDYEESGVINIDIRSKDEIEEIYQGIRSMQIRIIDYLKNMFTLEEDKKKAEDDIKHKEEEIDQLSIESITDPLTGIGNKTAYIKKIEELNKEIKKPETELALVMVDLNRLKHVNDEYGHKSGDDYIKGCCHMMCERFKHSPVYRIGGDEFVAVLMGHDYELRKELVEGLRDDYEKTYNQTDVSPWLRYSAAVGVAEKASDDKTVDLIFKRADEAMYEDKTRFESKYSIKSR